MSVASSMCNWLRYQQRSKEENQKQRGCITWVVSETESTSWRHVVMTTFSSDLFSHVVITRMPANRPSAIWRINIVMLVISPNISLSSSCGVYDWLSVASLLPRDCKPLLRLSSFHFYWGLSQRRLWAQFCAFLSTPIFDRLDFCPQLSLIS